MPITGSTNPEMKKKTSTHCEKLGIKGKVEDVVRVVWRDKAVAQQLLGICVRPCSKVRKEA